MRRGRQQRSLLRGIHERSQSARALFRIFGAIPPRLEDRRFEIRGIQPRGCRVDRQAERLDLVVAKLEALGGRLEESSSRLL